MNNIDEFEYVIVGSGTAGSVVAARLSENADCRILVLEAGGSDRGFWLRLPVGYYKSIYNSRVSHLYRGEADDGIDGRQMDVPRGRVVGGSSSINGLIYIRGQPQDFDEWAARGADGWSYRDVLPYFRSIESYAGTPSQFRGGHGPLQVSDLRNRNAACEMWLEAARQSGIHDNPDYNGEDAYGLARYQLTLRGRWRDSAATAFLKPALVRENLTLLTRARVVGLDFDGSHVVGLRYVRDNKIQTVRARCEVILAAGSVQSPQILQLSGIGPANLLQHHGIEVRVDAPEVGENLANHLQMRTIVELSERGKSLNDDVRNPFKLARMGLDWLFGAKGSLTVGAGQVGGATCTKFAHGDRPDLQLFVMPLSVDKPGTPLHKYSGFTTSFWLCHPESRGSLAIASADPLADPIIRTNYLSTQRDRDVMVEGLKIVRDIHRRPAFSGAWRREIIPGPDVQTDDEIIAAIRRYASTVYHLVGTCRMGSDPGSVVDPQLRVRGVTGLRIADASIMPCITSANTNAPTFMIGEKAAELIRSGASPGEKSKGKDSK